MTRYAPSRSYLSAGGIALALAATSGWYAFQWATAAVATVLFAASAALLLFLATRPAVRAGEEELVVGERVIPWRSIRRVDRTGWISPLVVRLKLADDSSLLLIYAGDWESGNSLLRHIRKSAKQALIDGVPYRQFWGAALPPGREAAKLPSPRYRVLRTEDEAEVERLYQRLKAVGHLDPSSPADEK